MTGSDDLARPRAPRPHLGRCGRRRSCWRPGCRAEFTGYATVEVLPDGAVIAHCHGGRYDASDVIAQLADSADDDAPRLAPGRIRELVATVPNAWLDR